MRRSASRKTGQPNSTSSVNSSPADFFRSASSKATSKELERVDNLFYSYANGSSGMIDPEGIETLCSDMEVDHTDVRILMLAWRMKSEKQGYFSLEEWRRGLKALRADTVHKIKKALPELEKEVRRPSTFVEFYSYAFQYCLTEEKQKSIDIESICELLDLVPGTQFRAQVDLFVEYLKAQNDYKVINMDQWMGFYRFCNEVKVVVPNLLTEKSNTVNKSKRFGEDEKIDSLRGK
ncbi:DCN1-like protein 4 isoform X1 [Juglans microcarpa x Juglans regia]|uniref:DCN1-like protein 4 isoform X1 n=1 Tax=Juglans microcarpa x Juglans regia TaxID=2249226 RepID=UPI001B7E4BED|nr:DCN1-like protein 4 isoform X1 [Juglans microcarpa x Juglans regia]